MRFLFALSTALWLVATASAAGASQPKAVTVVQKPSVYIVVHAAGGGVDVAYDLTKPVSSMAFDNRALVQRPESWQLVDAPDLLIAKGAVRSISDTPFQSFRIHLTPDDVGATRRLISLVSFGGDTLGLYLGAVLPDMKMFDAHLCVEDRPGVCSDRKAAPGYFRLHASGWIDAVTLRQGPVVVIGPRPFTDEGDYRSLYADATPQALRNRIKSFMTAELRFYRDRMGLELEDVPTVMVTSVSGKAPSWSLRPYLFSTVHIELEGVSVGRPLPEKQMDMLFFQLHRAIAILHAQFAFRTKEVSAQRWFYGGILNVWTHASSLGGAKGAVKASKLLRMSVAACRAIPKGGKGPSFFCGEMTEWLADALVRRATGGRETLVDLWDETIEATPLANNQLNIALFLAHLKTYDPDGFVAALVADFEAGRPLNEDLLDRALLKIGRKDLVADAE